MNNILNPRRMTLYMHKHYTENAKNYIWQTVSIVIALLIMNFLSMYKNLPHITPLCFTLFYIIVLCIWVPMTMKSFYQKETRIQSLTLPVSRLEQYLFTILNVIILLITIILLNLSLLYILNIYFKSEINFADYFYYFFFISPKSPTLFIILATVLAIWSIAGCKENPMKSYSYTIIGYTIINLLLFLPSTIKNSIDLYSSSSNGFIPYFYIKTTQSFPELTINYNISWLTEKQIETIYLILIIITLFVLLISGYYKFREKQIK